MAVLRSRVVRSAEVCVVWQMTQYAARGGGSFDSGNHGSGHPPVIAAGPRAQLEGR